jgi:hypothetical protein
MSLSLSKLKLSDIGHRVVGDRSIYITNKILKSGLIVLSLEDRVYSINKSIYYGLWEVWIEMNNTLQTLKDIQDLTLAVIAKERLLDIPRDTLETRIRDPMIIRGSIPCIKLLFRMDKENKLTTNIFQKNAEGKNVEITSPTNTPLDILKPGAVIRSAIRLDSMHIREGKIIWNLKLEQALLVTPAPTWFSTPLSCIGRVTDPTLLTKDVCHLTYDMIVDEDEAYLTQCGHLYLRTNLWDWWSKRVERICPYCNKLEPPCPCHSCK